MYPSSLLKPTEKKQSELGTKIENLTNDAMKYVKKPEEIVHWDHSFFEEPYILIYWKCCQICNIQYIFLVSSICSF